MITVDLLIFDLDGTLVESKEDIFNAVNFTLRKLGLAERSFDEVISFVGTGVEDLIRESIGDKGRGLFEEGVSIFEDYFKKRPAETSRLYPHV